MISITDGQIFLEADLFYSGIRPAINAGASVSRVGGAAQIKAMKQVAGRLRLDLAQYRELSAFSQFAAELDAKTREQILQGSRMVEILKQVQFQPMAVEKQVALIWAGESGLLKEIPVDKMVKLEADYLAFLENSGGGVLSIIRKERFLSDETIEKLKKLTVDFLETWQGNVK